MMEMPRPLEDKRIVVVGGAGLLGSALCNALAAAGARLAIADRDGAAAQTLAAAISEEFRSEPLVIETSITEKSSIEAMIARAVGEFGGIDGLVNAAYPRNSRYGRKFEDVEYADFCENVDLHLGGYFLVSQRILEYFKQAGGGSLLNISSIYGVVAPRFEIYRDTPMTMPVEYAAVKSALLHLTRYMAKYYAGTDIRVNALSLGGLLDRQPEAFLGAYKQYCLDKGMLDPQDIVGTIVFLMSDASRYVNGQNIIVDDGFTL